VRVEHGQEGPTQVHRGVLLRVVPAHLDPPTSPA
jgi:hypothetical protein